MDNERVAWFAKLKAKLKQASRFISCTRSTEVAEGFIDGED
jgi:hypothetical protein